LSLVAWRRHLAGAAVWMVLGGAVGCLDAAPTFAPRGQIPPFIVAGQVDPPIGAIYDGPIPFPINVPFRSEDVNVPLVAQLFRDLVPGAPENNLAAREFVDPGVFEDTSRSVRMEWSDLLDGCHSVTLILTYYDNIDLSDLPRDETRAARVVWWLNADDVNGDVLISSCPGGSQIDSAIQ
jgi:hypothetical protein